MKEFGQYNLSLKTKEVTHLTKLMIIVLSH